jgi:hypothetical protein
MVPLVKMIIILFVIVGVAAPTSYVAYNYLSTPSVQATDFIPSNSSMVIHYDINNTNAYIFTTNTSGAIIINYNMSAFKDTINSSSSSIISHNSTSNVSISLNCTYDSYAIYRVTGLTINTSFSGRLTVPSLINTSTEYFSPVSSSLFVAGPLAGVKVSLESYHTGQYLQRESKYLKIKNKGIGFYINMNSLNINKNLPSNTSSTLKIFSDQFQGVFVFGNVSNYYTNITMTDVSGSLEKNISTVTSLLFPTNLTVSNSYIDRTYFTELNVGFKNFNYVYNKILNKLPTS